MMAMMIKEGFNKNIGITPRPGIINKRGICTFVEKDLELGNANVAECHSIVILPASSWTVLYCTVLYCTIIFLLLLGGVGHHVEQ